MSAIPVDRLRRLRLAAQRLIPESRASGALEATRAVVGIQAQDVRAAGLSLRSRTTGLIRPDVDGEPGLIRTWTFRGTVHLHAAEDLPWIHALTGARYGSRFGDLIVKRGEIDVCRALLGPLMEELAAEPLTRAAAFERLIAKGRAVPVSGAVNVVMPWVAAQGLIAGLPDGRFRPADPPPAMDPDEALATMARRYLAAHAPAGAPDLARWSGLPLGVARRSLAAIETEDAGDDLRVLPGGFDAAPPAAPPALLLAGFDTSMLGWRTREPLVAAADDRHVLPGGGIVRPVVLAGGRAVGTWRLSGSGGRRRLELDSFGRRPSARALAAEAADVGRFLGVEVHAPS